MGLDWKEWNRSDIIYGIIVPLIVVLVIVGISWGGSYLMSGGGIGGGSFGIVFGIISSLQELLLTVVIPLLLGLVWNRWAGGASGFLLGTIWSMWYAIKYGLGGGFFGERIDLGPTLLGWVLSAMLIGYMAGALNKRSESFRRMLIVALVTTTVGGFFLFGMFQLSPSNVIAFDFAGFAFNVAPRIAAGAVVAVLAKVFMWYGVAMHKT